MAWLAPCGRPRNTPSTGPAPPAVSSAGSQGWKTRSGYAAARPGYSAATGVPAWESPVAKRTSRSGWDAQIRNSSAPV